MVFIIDEGSSFKAPMSKVWQLVQSPQEHLHPSQINPQFSMDGEHPTVSFDVKMQDGKQAHNKIRMTLFPPVGFSLEYLEGPFAGSRSVNYYTPKGNETGVTVVGEFTSPMLSGEQLKQGVMMSLETAFKEDSENLKRM